MPGGPATLLASPNTTDLRWESWEYGACKHILYRTVGGYSEPESGFKVALQSPYFTSHPVANAFCRCSISAVSCHRFCFCCSSCTRSPAPGRSWPVRRSSSWRCTRCWGSPRPPAFSAASSCSSLPGQRESRVMDCTGNCAAPTRTGRRRDWRWWAGPASRPRSPRSSSPP